MGLHSRPGAIGRQSPLPVDYAADLRDPADGEKVPRCAVCGVPEGRELVGAWDGQGVYRLRVCPACLTRWNRFDPDPLDVSDAAGKFQ